MKYVRPIDTHVHLRWNENGGTVFLESGMRDANYVKLAAVFDMPNTDPVLKDKSSVDERVKLVEKYRGDVEYYINVAVTPNIAQQREAFELVRNHERVVSDKTFYVHSTKSGGIEIILEPDQRIVWRHRGDLRYKGISEGHFEDGSLFKVKFDYTKPETHSVRQCPEAEPVQFEKQFRFAYDAGFEGTFVVLHASNPDTIDLGDALVKAFSPKFRVMYETTPHHMFLNVEQDYPLHGNLVKMNPPLRPKVMQERLLEYVLSGRTHFIGTDHAPHSWSNKLSDNPPSGIPGIAFWPKLIELLRGYDMSEDDVTRLTFGNANETYLNGRLKPEIVEVEYNPDLWKTYGWNSFSRIDGTS